MNKCIFAGRIGRLESKTTATEKKMASFSIAINRYSKGNKTTTWVNCVAWTSNAEFLLKHFKKGDGIIVETYFVNREYKDEEFTIQYIQEFVVDRIHFPIGAAGSNPPADKHLLEDLPF